MGTLDARLIARRCERRQALRGLRRARPGRPARRASASLARRITPSPRRPRSWTTASSPARWCSTARTTTCRAAWCARTTCAPARWCGTGTRSRPAQQHGVRRRGQAASTGAAPPTCGRSSRWTPSATWCSCPPATPRPTSYGGDRGGNLDYYSSSVVALDGRHGRARRGTSRRCITTSGTTTRRRSRRCSTSSATAGRSPRWRSRPRWATCSCSNRETGEPLFPVEERPVPQDGAVPGEYLAPDPALPGRSRRRCTRAGSRRTTPGVSRSGTRRMPQADRGAPQRRHLHAAVAAGLRVLPERLRRQQLGHAGHRSGAQADHR